MKIGIMQPYLGYFQLITAVDKYVILDDVQYIKGGWINRNRILMQGQPKLFTLPINKSPFQFNINQRHFAESYPEDCEKFLRIIKQAYSKAPYFPDVFSLVENVLSNGESNLMSVLYPSILSICEYLNINTELVISSKVDRDRLLKKEKMVIDIVKRQGGNEYINSIGGRDLYSKSYFNKNGVSLKFLEMKNINYKQFENEFVSNLSIIDVLMFNSKKDVKKLLSQYNLV